MDPKVLILRPGIEAGGGVNYYFNSLEKHMPSTIEYLYRGARYYPYRSGIIRELFRLIADYFCYILTICLKRYDLIHLNTTLDKRGVIRDTVYIIIAKLLFYKVVLYFRGWDKDFEQRIDQNKYRFFKKLLQKLNALICLSSDSKDCLRRWGYRGAIYNETTTVDIRLLKGLKIVDLCKKDFTSQEINILYLARLERDKGIYLVIDTFKELLVDYPHLKLHIAGTGTEQEQVRSYIQENLIGNTILYGYVKGADKVRLLMCCHIFFFPTWYKEGMPNAVLEAMAFGMPVVTRPVAGLSDIIIENQTGFLSTSLNASDYVTIFHRILAHPELLKDISAYNIQYAREAFYSNIVAQRILNIYNNLLS